MANKNAEFKYFYYPEISLKGSLCTYPRNSYAEVWQWSSTELAEQV